MQTDKNHLWTQASILSIVPPFSFGFEINFVEDCCITSSVEVNIFFLVLYIDDILFTINDIFLLHDIKRFLSIFFFEMKDLGDTSFVLGIQIDRVRSRGILGLSQMSYIDKVLKRFDMQGCKPHDTPVTKGDKFNLNKCPKNSLEVQEMRKISYSSVIGSMYYA